MTYHPRLKWFLVILTLILIGILVATALTIRNQTQSEQDSQNSSLESDLMRNQPTKKDVEKRLDALNADAFSQPSDHPKTNTETIQKQLDTLNVQDSGMPEQNSRTPEEMKAQLDALKKSR